MQTIYKHEHKSKEELLRESLEKGEQPKIELVVKYVIHDWLDQYYEMKLQSGMTHIPNMTSSYTDMPFSGSGGFHSSTENSAMKKVGAQEWLDYFHSKMSKLPELHQKVIERKFLKRESDGKYPSDDIVYIDLHMGRTYYYHRKKEALHWLGLALLSESNTLTSKSFT